MSTSRLKTSRQPSAAVWRAAARAFRNFTFQRVQVVRLRHGPAGIKDSFWESSSLYGIRVGRAVGGRLPRPTGRPRNLPGAGYGESSSARRGRILEAGRHGQSIRHAGFQQIARVQYDARQGTRSRAAAPGSASGRDKHRTTHTEPRHSTASRN